MNDTIAIVEDEADIRKLLKLHLDKAGFKVALFENGSDFLSALNSNNFDLLVLDIMLPGIDGIDVLKEIRRNPLWKTLPVIMLTALSEELDVVLGLELGADDYITKPFSTREFVARVKSVLRRIRTPDDDGAIRIGDMMIHPENHLVKIGDQQVDLTATEFKILLELARKHGRVFSRSDILEMLGDERRFVIDRTIDVHILKIRKKLKSYGQYLKTIRGIGYKFSDEIPFDTKEKK